MTNLDAVTPKRNQRAIFVGKTGSGKTTLAVEILPAYRYVIAIDPLHVLGGKLNTDKAYRDAYSEVHGTQAPRDKQDYSYQPYTVCNTPQQVAERIGSVARLLYQPAPEHMNHESYNVVYQVVFESGNRMIYTDEVLRVVRPNGQAPPYYEACLTAGRQRGVGCMSATQRPSKVDLRILSEAEFFFCFALRLPQDLQRMGDLMGEEVEKKPAKGHHFWFASEQREQPIYLTLELD